MKFRRLDSPRQFVAKPRLNAVEAAYKGNRIALGGSQRGLVVERDECAVLLCEAARQSGFSRLPRTANCDDSSVTQSGANLGLGNA
jgi:hypothetical protein